MNSSVATTQDEKENLPSSTGRSRPRTLPHPQPLPQVTLT